VNWDLFLPWLAYWSGTCLACQFVGLYIGYRWGRDRESEAAQRQRESEASQ
jgi:hypothetical protein